jgi:hypothetical protein
VENLRDRLIALDYSSTQTELHFLYDAELRRVKKEVKVNGSTVDRDTLLIRRFKRGSPPSTGQLKGQVVSAAIAPD